MGYNEVSTVVLTKWFSSSWIGLDQCFSTIPPEEIDAWGFHPLFIDALFIDFFIDFFFLIHVGCPGQLTRTTTIPHGPLDILQAQEQVKHRGGDRRAHRGSNQEGGRNKSTMDHSS